MIRTGQEARIEVVVFSMENWRSQAHRRTFRRRNLYRGPISRMMSAEEITPRSTCQLLSDQNPESLVTDLVEKPARIGRKKQPPCLDIASEVRSIRILNFVRFTFGSSIDNSLYRLETPILEVLKLA
jgi:hypothetical protein